MILITTVAYTFGRKQVLILGALLMALAGCVFALTKQSVGSDACSSIRHDQSFRKEVGSFLYQASDSATDESRSLQDEGFLRLQSCSAQSLEHSERMAVVHPEERAASAGILSVSRNTGAAIAPIFTAPIWSIRY